MSTVVCSWYKPSRVAWAHYGLLGQAAEAQKIMDGKFIDDRKVQCSLQKPPFLPMRLPGRHMKYSVQIGNLAPTITSEYLQRRFRSADHVAMGKLSHEYSTQEAADLVRALLQQAGNLESFDVNFSSNPRFEKALAKFSSRKEARAVLERLSGHVISELKTKLFLSLRVSVKFKILRDLFRAVETELNDFRVQVLAADHITLAKYQSEDRSTLLTLRIYGEDAKAIAKAKSSIETILAGTPAKKQGEILWDDFFLKPEGTVYLKHIQEMHEAFIYRDARRRRLLLYGSSDKMRQLQDALVEKVNGLAEQSHKIILTPTTRRRVFQGGLQQISLIIGEGKAGLRITSTETTLNVRGSEEDVRNAKAILEDSYVAFGKTKTQSAGVETECSVCWTEADDAYRTTCGHTYCKECFSGLCASATSPENFPLKCLGDATRCTHVFGMAELQKALSTSAFDELLKAAVQIYLRTRPNEYQYCVTADCPQLYRTTTNGRVFDCPGCLTHICTTCQAVSHDGYTCAEYKDLSSEGSLAFKKWMDENKVKPCPKCGTPIQKAYGCNHMTCTLCSTHFCWFCMEVCSSGKIYDHMRGKHGNFGIDQPDNLEDEAVELGHLRRMGLH